MIEYIANAEQNILLWLQNNMRNDILNHIMKLITSLGNGGIIWIIVALVLLIPKKTRKTGIMVISGLLLSFLVNNIILKNLVARRLARCPKTILQFPKPPRQNPFLLVLDRLN